MIDTSILFQRNYTNCLRGISVLIIFFLHIIFKWEDMPRFLSLPASLFVSVFIFLSGYGIHESYKKHGLKGYWHKRFKRIILPYTLLITVSIPFTNNFLTSAVLTFRRG
jgi:peptidoglycan/LPS O-acetylase OafA/YrhL